MSQPMTVYLVLISLEQEIERAKKSFGIHVGCVNLIDLQAFFSPVHSSVKTPLILILFVNNQPHKRA